MNYLGNREHFFGLRRAAAALVAGTMATYTGWAVAVPYFSDTSLTSNASSLTGAWTITGSTALTTAQLPGAGSGPYLITGPTDGQRNNTATLSLSGLTAGLQYRVLFSLVTIGDWTGAAGSNDDLISVKWNPTSETATTYVDATFSNTTGSGNTQSFSDSTRTAGTGGTLAPTTDSDVKVGTADTASNLTTADYSVYYFGYGANAGFTFTTTAAVAGTLTFAFSGLGGGANWQIGNVIVNVPEVTSIAGLSTLASLALGGLYLRSRRERNASFAA